MTTEKLATKLINLSTDSGVYKMLDRTGQVIYIGKAKNLKKRVSQYFVKKSSSDKTQVLRKNIYDFSVIITKTENQALFLENDLIKQYKPKYNILLKDAKSYPYIYLSNDKHPRLGLFRGKKTKLSIFWAISIGSCCSRRFIFIKKNIQSPPVFRWFLSFPLKTLSRISNQPLQCTLCRKNF